MTKTRKLILIAAALLAVLLLVGAVAAALHTQTANNYSAQLTRGQKYLDNNDFDNAVLCYQRAVNAAPEQADGYIGLAQAYIGLEKMTLAEKVLNTGLEKTGSARMQWMLETYFTGGDYGAETAVQVDLSAGKGGGFDTALMDKIALFTYADYRLDEEIQSEGAEGAGYRVQTTAMTLDFRNTEENKRVIDPNTGKPYSTQRPNSVTLTDVGLLFGSSEFTIDQLRQTDASAVELLQEEDAWYVTFTYQGCEGKIACDENGTIHAGAWNQFTPSRAEPEEDGFTVQGQIINAQTGGGVSGAELEITPTQGDVITERSTAGGRYTATLPDGSYTVRIRCSGFVEEEFTLVVHRAISNQNFTISPQLAEGEIRIVLEWGASPRDLDSYLDGTTDSGVSVNTSFYHKQEVRDGTVLAQLDVDDTSGYGPETTTIYDPNGVYDFYVVDFTQSGTMSDSGATVKIYSGDQAPVVINVCAGLGNEWAVCRIDHGEVQVVNAPR